MDTSLPSLDAPEAQLPRLRRLARSLVQGDPQLAEDLVQDAWLVTLQREKEPHWRGLMQNLLFRRRRAEARRRRHENLAARPEHALDVVEETTLLRELTDHVLALDEPQRTTVLMRFLEELPPREIARRMNCPVATVNSRLARGLARMRARLGADQATRERWALGLLPYVGRRQDALLGLGVLLSTKTIAAVAGVALLAFAGWRVLAAPAPSDATPLATVAPEAEVERAGLAAPDEEPPARLVEAQDVSTRIGVREELEQMQAEPAAAPDPGRATQTATLSGKVLIPHAWELTEFMLLAYSGDDSQWKRGELVPDPAARPSDFFEFEFEFAELPAGTAVLLFQPVQSFERFELPADGLRNVVLEIPPPVTATIQVYDSLTGAVAPDGQVGWSMEMPAEITEYSNNGVDRQGAEPVTVQVPEGRASFFFHHSEYGSEETPFELTAGENQVTLEVAPATAVTLAFYDELGAPTRHPRIGWSEFRGPGSMIGQSAVEDAPHKIRIKLSDPGTYRVVISAATLEGIHDPEPFELTVFEGEKLEREVRLVAK